MVQEGFIIFKITDLLISQTKNILTKSFTNHLLDIYHSAADRRQEVYLVFQRVFTNTNFSHSLAVGNNEANYSIDNSNEMVEYFSLKGSVDHLLPAYLFSLYRSLYKSL